MTFRLCTVRHYAEVPAGMQAVWDWEHSHMMEHISRIKVLLEMYTK